MLRRRGLLLGLAGLAGGAGPMPDGTQAWRWSYHGTGIDAHGTLITARQADRNGWLQILTIQGERNGERIITLQPAGTAILGNEPYAVDNRVRQIMPYFSHAGFGYQLASGAYANPFVSDTLSPPGGYEFFSGPPAQPGAARVMREVPVAFDITG